MHRQLRGLAVLGLVVACVLALAAMLGGWSALLDVAIGLGLLLALIGPLGFLAVVLFLRGAIPEFPELTPALGEQLSEDLEAVDRAFLACGFRRVGGLSLLNTTPRTRILNYVHPDLAIYGTAQKIWRGNTTFGLISPRADAPGNLETLANPEVDAVPPPQGTLRQVVEGASVAILLGHHASALSTLRSEGVSFDPVAPERLEDEMRLSTVRQRAIVRSRPFRCAAVLLWRSLTGAYPNLGPLSERPGPAVMSRPIRTSS